ncbi:MAG: Uma2 family endonuclease [Thermomicrobiales bacterium]
MGNQAGESYDEKDTLSSGRSSESERWCAHDRKSVAPGPSPCRASIARSPPTLLTWPDDGWQYEIVDGRPVRMSPAGLEHSDVTGDLYSATRVVARRLGGLVTLPDTGFRFSHPDGRELLLVPDVAYLSPERVAQLPRAGASRAAATSMSSPISRLRWHRRISTAQRWPRKRSSSWNVACSSSG